MEATLDAFVPNNRKARRAHYAASAIVRRKLPKGDADRDREFVYAPEKLSLEFGSSETLTFLNKVRACADCANPNQRFAIDLVKTRSVEISGAIALVAELDRWQRRKLTRLQPSTVTAWHPEVISDLHSLGFFKLLGTKLPKGLTQPTSKARAVQRF